ncbi:MAG: AraC family transcriptional regulator [Clostridia bacterium]|jgi:AraC-like DNA-binding protein|nr:AraC family transcriptional regulator [Clostridia bacterium]
MEYGKNIENTFNFLAPTDLNMYYCGYKANNPLHSYGPAMRDHYLIVYTRSGNGIFKIKDTVYPISKKCIFVIFPHHEVFYQADLVHPWENIWIGVYGSLIPSYLDNLGLSPDSPILSIANPDIIENTLKSILDLSASKTMSDKINCISLLHHFFAILSKDSSLRDKSFSQKQYVELALNFINYNYDRGISSIDISEHLNLDRSYFSKIFKEETGVTPTDYLNNLRIKKACTLLRNTSISIQTISYSIGIYDQFYFSRLFKNIIGCTPSYYRKRQ